MGTSKQLFTCIVQYLYAHDHQNGLQRNANVKMAVPFGSQRALLAVLAEYTNMAFL